MTKLAIVPKFDMDPAFEEAATPPTPEAANEGQAVPKFIVQMQRPRYATPEDERIAMQQQQYGYDL